ncbi:MAG: hypothetical protein MJZ38_05795 [archaeon]|nr:hypothetical protein [archaeon]
MNSNRLMMLYLGMAVVAVLVALVKFDWMVAIAEAMAFIVGYYPVHRHRECHHRSFLLVGIASSVLLILLSLVIMSGALSEYLWGPVQWIVIIQLMVLSVLTFNVGMMFSVLLDAYTESQFSRRWMLVFAMVFTFAFSAFYAFMAGFAIWADGLPFTNEEIAIHGRVTHPILMADPGCASVVGILCAVVGRRLIKPVEKEELLGGI